MSEKNNQAIDAAVRDTKAGTGIGTANYAKHAKMGRRTSNHLAPPADAIFQE